MAKSIVLITGCSSGFGMLSAARLAAAEHTVYATMRDLTKQERLLKETARRGTEVKILSLDVTDDASIDRVVTRITGEHGQLDVLVNNAGYGLGGAFEDLLEAEFRAQMETNFFGVLKMIRHCLPLLRRSSAAKIINLSSIAGLSGIPGLSAYNASKFALEGFSEALSHELAVFGISVTLIEPGSYQTDVQKNSRLAQNFYNPDSPYLEYSKRLLASTQRRVARRDGNPEDIAGLIERVINTQKPAMRYIAGRDARVLAFLRRTLPFGAYSRFLNRVLSR